MSYLDCAIEAARARKNTNQMLRAYGLEDHITHDPEPEKQCGDCEHFDACPCGCGWGVCGADGEWKKSDDWCF